MHRDDTRCTFSRRPAMVRLALTALLALTGLSRLPAEPVVPVFPPTAFDEAKSNAQVSVYKPNQMCPPIPKYEYTDAGRVILVKRYADIPVRDRTGLIKYKYVENKQGVEHFERCAKLSRGAHEILSEQQKAVLAAWGQPDYLRGPFKSTRGDFVIEWVYHPLNRLFQFVDRTMVYQGPLTDQERTVLTHGVPSEVIVVQLEPNIRRETWIYRPIWPTSFSYMRERMFSFSNGEIVYSQETP